ncbi:hypothetical protein [Pyrococcus kukulkanii]|uniref:hypothetical protein n=1 Tax=Pyrococcus kukulkanii TaxID=1609559 RepID=UPI00137A2A5E|nr:hypothetical protein [Pyrococcus kukulkanii]
MNELEKRIKETMEFERIIKNIKIVNEEEAEALKREIAKAVARYYGVIQDEGGNPEETWREGNNPTSNHRHCPRALHRGGQR